MDKVKTPWRGAVLVTGASTGIGEATTYVLAAQGFHVFAGVRNANDAARLAGRDPAHIDGVLLDVTDQASIDAALATIREKLADRGLAGLVNNAGIALGGPLECTPIDVLRRTLDVNVIGAMAVTKAFLPLIRQGNGRIVNMSSISGRVALPFMGQYAASKFALRALSESLRGELKPWGIEVVMIEPGQIATPIWGKGVSEGDRLQADWPPEARERYGATMTALLNHVRDGKGLPPERVAQAVLHALTAPRPKTCYVVGRDSRFLRWFGRLPARWRDRLFARAAPK
jgi:NAD(P)-dependent dehydrogenase (short-subunit alcohol dehydrogenase family)